MRLRRGDAASQALQAGVTLKLLAQLVNIQRFAHAAVVQGVGDVHHSHTFSRCCMLRHQARRKLVPGSNAR